MAVILIITIYLNQKQFKLKRLKDLIFKNSSYNFSEQHQILEKTHNDWKKDIEQLDDICVIGFKI